MNSLNVTISISRNSDRLMIYMPKQLGQLMGEKKWCVERGNLIGQFRLTPTVENSASTVFLRGASILAYEHREDTCKIELSVPSTIDFPYFGKVEIQARYDDGDLTWAMPKTLPEPRPYTKHGRTVRGDDIAQLRVLLEKLNALLLSSQQIRAEVQFSVSMEQSGACQIKAKRSVMEDLS